MWIGKQGSLGSSHPESSVVICADQEGDLAGEGDRVVDGSNRLLLLGVGTGGRCAPTQETLLPALPRSCWKCHLSTIDSFLYSDVYNQVCKEYDLYAAVAKRLHVWLVM